MYCTLGFNSLGFAFWYFRWWHFFILLEDVHYITKHTTALYIYIFTAPLCVYGVVAHLETDYNNIVEWFSVNSLQGNPWKFQFYLLSSNNVDKCNISLCIGDMVLKTESSHVLGVFHDDVIRWKHFPRYWAFVREIYRSPVNSPHKGQWRGALMFSLICVWINYWVNNREAGDLRRYRAHYDVTVQFSSLDYWTQAARAASVSRSS